MTQFLVSALVDGQHLAFDPLVDQLSYDGPTQNAADVRVAQLPSGISLTLAGKTIFLDGVTLGNLGLFNLTFANVSILYVGDLLPTTQNDYMPVGYFAGASTRNDQYILLNGASKVIAGSGDDWIVGAVDQSGVVQVTEAGGTGSPSAGSGPTLSGDGQSVCFESGWTGYGSQSNSSTDVFVKDMQTGLFTNEHLSSTGAFGLSGSGGSSISGDGQTVVYYSSSTLVPNGPQFQSVYAADVGSLAIECVSRDAGGADGNGVSKDPDVSFDGGYVAFRSVATNFAAGGSAQQYDVFVKDRQTGSLTRVSTDLTGGDANSDCEGVQISGDGRYVVFSSAATDLTATLTGGGKNDIYLWDSTTAALTNITGGAAGSGNSINADVVGASGQGTRVVFQSEKALVAGDTNAANDVYIYDIATQTFTCASTRANGSFTSAGAQDGSISANGRYAVFRSFASDLVPGDTNGFADIFIKDLTTGEVRLLSSPATGQSNGQSNGHAAGAPVISLGGDWIVFETSATNLSGTDANGFLTDIYRVYNPLLESTLEGGAGDDTYVLSKPDLITELVGEGTDTVRANFSYRLGANLEHLVLLGAGNRAGRGNGLDNAITGNSGDNLLDGLGGTDTVSYVNANAAVTVSLAIGGAQATGFGSDTLLNFENLTGSRFNDQLSGDAGANVLDGGLGGDTMTGGDGSDTYICDANTDIIVETGLVAAETDTVMAGVNWTLGARLENLTLTGGIATNGSGNNLDNVLRGNSAANLLNGFSGNDALFGNGGNDSLTGGSGNDTLTGGLGNDTANGGEGSDTYVVDANTDTIVETGVTLGDIDTVQSAVNWTLGARLENLTLTGGAAINGSGNSSDNAVTGNGAANLLTGASGNDSLSGLGGADTLRGDAGNDVLTGGAGADSFQFNSTVGSDIVADFSSGTDRLQMSIGALQIGDGDLLVEGAVATGGPGGFGALAELVILTANIAGLTAADAAAAAGSANAAYAIGQKVLFAVDTGSSSALFLFTSAGADATISAAELTLLATLQGTGSTTLGDYLFST